MPDNLDLKDISGKKTITHEILGHGSTIAYIPDKVYCTVAGMNMFLDENGMASSSGITGHFMEESIADLISAYAIKQKLFGEDNDYTFETYAFSALCRSADCYITDFANGGVDYLIKCMQNKGITNPYQTILSLDSESMYFRYSKDPKNIAIKECMLGYFLNAAETKKANGESEKDIEIWAKDSLSEYENFVHTDEKNNIHAYSMKGKKVSINPDKIEKNVIAEIQKMMKKTKNPTEKSDNNEIGEK